MKTLKQVITWLIYGFIILLPLQTRWIYKAGSIDGQYFEYGTLSLYGTELLLGVMIVLGIIYALPLLRKIKQGVKANYVGVIVTVLLLLFLAINVLLSGNQEVAWQKLGWLILAAAFASLILLVRPKLINLGVAFTTSALAQSYFAIKQFMEQKIIANKWLGMAAQDPEILGTPVVETVDGRWLRSFGTLTGPNVLAPFLVISLLFITHLFYQARTKKEKRFFLLSYVIIAVALLTTFSKAAILCAIGATLVYSFLVRKEAARTKAVAKLSLVFLFVIIVFTISFPNLIMTRIQGTARLEQNSYSERLEQYQEFNGLAGKNWLWGAGLGNYAMELQRVKPDLEAWAYQPIHNAWLVMIAEVGLLGVLIKLGFLLWRLIKRSNDGAFAFIILGSTSFMALFYHFWWSLWFGLLFLGLIGAITFIQKSEKTKQP
jgi:hypothetical protein